MNSKLDAPHNFRFRDVSDIVKTRIKMSLKGAMLLGDSQNKPLQIWKKSGSIAFHSLISDIAVSFWNKHQNDKLSPSQFVTLLNDYIIERVEAHEIVDCRIFQTN